MSNRELIDNFFIKNFKELQFITKKISIGCKDDPDDVLQETILDVYNKDEQKIVELINRGELMFYIVRVFKFSLYSPTSSYQRHNNKYKNEGLDLDQIEKNFNYHTQQDKDIQEKENIEKVLLSLEPILAQCSWFDRKVFKTYVESTKTFKELEIETDIPSSSLFQAYRRVQRVIRKQNKIKPIN